jgi:nucleoid DNA-binding protein
LTLCPKSIKAFIKQIPVEDSIKKSELAAALSDETGLLEKKAREVMKPFFQDMSDVLAAGDRVEICDFCSFSAKGY